MASRARSAFFDLLPDRSLLLFLGGVFFVFAPVGPLFATRLADPRPWSVMLLHWAISGGLGVCWAATFIRSRWFAVGIVVLSATMIAIYGPLQRSPVGGGGAPSLSAIAINGFIVAGYVLFVLFIRGQGKKTMQPASSALPRGGVRDATARGTQPTLGSVRPGVRWRSHDAPAGGDSRGGRCRRVRARPADRRPVAGSGAGPRLSPTIARWPCTANGRRFASTPS